MTLEEFMNFFTIKYHGNYIVQHPTIICTTFSEKMVVLQQLQEMGYEMGEGSLRCLNDCPNGDDLRTFLCPYLTRDSSGREVVANRSLNFYQSEEEPKIYFADFLNAVESYDETSDDETSVKDLSDFLKSATRR